MSTCVTAFRARYGLTAVEVAHAMPVLRHVHPDLQRWPGPDLASIRHLAGRSGVRDGAVRTALSRGCAAGTLELVGSRYRLGPTSIEQAAAARAMLSRTSGYLVVVVSEGEEFDVRAVRDVLTRQGLRPLQRSVWIGARTVDDRLTPALRRCGLLSAVLVFHSDEIDQGAQDRLRQLWGLVERRAALRDFHRCLLSFVTDVRATDDELAWRCIEAAPVWYRIAILDEPPFPLPLIGPDHPLEQLNTDWSAALRRAAPALRRQLEVAR